MTDPATPSIPQHPAQAPAGWYPHPATGEQRWWDGSGWSEATQVAPVPPVFSQPGPTVLVAATNGYAAAALILGICGFVLMGIPLGIGLFLGGTPDILAVILGIVALNSPAGRAGIGRGPAVIGLVLGGVSLLSVFIGAGTLW
jgi:hypothetical protein